MSLVVRVLVLPLTCRHHHVRCRFPRPIFGVSATVLSVLFIYLCKKVLCEILQPGTFNEDVREYEKYTLYSMVILSRDKGDSVVVEH